MLLSTAMVEGDSIFIYDLPFRISLSVTAMALVRFYGFFGVLLSVGFSYRRAQFQPLTAGAKRIPGRLHELPFAPIIFRGASAL
jgi:hypothetical protein